MTFTSESRLTGRNRNSVLFMKLLKTVFEVENFQNQMMFLCWIKAKLFQTSLCVTSAGLRTGWISRQRCMVFKSTAASGSVFNIPCSRAGITDTCDKSTKKKLCNKFLQRLNEGVNTCINTGRPSKANFELPNVTSGPRKAAGDGLLIVSIQTFFLCLSIDFICLDIGNNYKLVTYPRTSIIFMFNSKQRWEK